MLIWNGRDDAPRRLVEGGARYDDESSSAHLSVVVIIAPKVRNPSSCPLLKVSASTVDHVVTVLLHGSTHGNVARGPS